MKNEECEFCGVKENCINYKLGRLETLKEIFKLKIADNLKEYIELEIKELEK